MKQQPIPAAVAVEFVMYESIGVFMFGEYDTAMATARGVFPSLVLQCTAVSLEIIMTLSYQYAAEPCLVNRPADIRALRRAIPPVRITLDARS